MMKFNPHSHFDLRQIEEALAESKFKLSPMAKKNLEKGSAQVRKLAHSSKPIYGVNTGFGRLAQVRISEHELVDLQVNILKSHATGIGPQTADKIIRRTMLLRALSLGKGYSGISASFVERHLVYLSRGLIPYIPQQGSVGASGDLAPLAHLGLTFVGLGQFVVSQKRISAKEILKRENLKPLKVGPKEGLALVNGTQFSLALALEAREQLMRLIPWMEKTAALCLEAHRGTAEVFDTRLHLVKAHPKQREVAKKFRALLQGSKHVKAHRDCDLVQDSYSFRCIPQVLGPIYSMLDKADELLTDEANSVSDNPILWSKTGELISGGHFHAHSVSLAADMIAIAATSLANISERRIDQLVNPLTTRGSAFLADRPGVESGFMIIQTATAAIASENKTLAHPASADTIPTNGNQEDHVSMAPWAGRKALMIVENLRRIIAAELLCAVRGAIHESTRTGQSFGPVLNEFLKDLAREVPALFRAGDREFGQDWEALENLIIETEV